MSNTNSTSRAALAAAASCALLLLCSCAGLPVHTAGAIARSTDSLPLEAYTGHPGDGFTRPGHASIDDDESPEDVPSVHATDGCCPHTWQPPGIEKPWPRDEYLFDGGDHQPGARVANDWRIYGLHLEDTVAHYDTLAGETLVEPANRVCIYSPRFAAVRQINNPILTQHRDRPSHVAMPVLPYRSDDLGIASTTVQPVQPVGELGTKRATIAVEKDGPITAINERSLSAFQDRYRPYEDFKFFRTGTLDSSEKARIAQRVAAAIVWSHDTALQVTVDQTKPIEAVGDQRAQVTYAFDLPSRPELRICKVASTSFARPGETVDFTLRYDNVGNQAIGNVTIVDNLTTRLEYVEGTAQSSREGSFSTQVNEGDSLVLRWEITEPLPPGEGGVIRFRCRVR